MRDVLEAAAADLAAAPFDRARWDVALDGLARAGGGWAGQLVAISPSRGFPLDMISGVPRDVLDGFETWGVDPANQPRLGIMRAPMMTTMVDYDFVSEPKRARSPFYGWLKTIDCSFACMSRIDAFDDVAVVAAALRHEGAGHSDTADREAFSALLPHVRTAARLQLKLEDQGARIALGMMEAVGQAALVCDALGRIVAMTPSAEAAVAAGAYVRVQNGRLAGTDPVCDTALGGAIARAGAPATFERPAAGRVRLYDRPRRNAITAEIAPVPPELAAFRVRAAVMVLLQLDRPAEAKGARLMRLYGLTTAEAEVALAIAQGAAATEIAAQRGVRISTVRSQLAALLAKTGTARQTELIALILRTLH